MAFWAFSTAYLFPRSSPLIRMWGRAYVSSKNGSPERRYLAKMVDGQSMVGSHLTSLRYGLFGDAKRHILSRSYCISRRALRACR